MSVHRKKKLRKYRAHTTHGGGSMKKRRGSGNRGGCGKAGTGKRADQKKFTILKSHGLSYFGKRGFRRHVSLGNGKTINISDLPDTPKINLTEQGIAKLLGKGTPKLKYTITVASCSEKAKEKIEKSGGQLILLSEQQE